MSQQVAEEALIQIRAKNHYSLNTGPINVYQCDQCHGYHFTSKGKSHAMLTDPKVQARIRQMQQGADWEDKFN
jgi:predicted CXXCH cytochrome family protein